MPTEHAAVRVVHKPWGVGDMHPWSDGDALGELWFERADNNNASTPALLLKLANRVPPTHSQLAGRAEARA